MALEDATFWLSIAFLMTGLALVFFEVFQPGFFIAIPGGALFIGGALGLIMPDIVYGVAGWIVWPLAIGGATLLNLWAYKKWAPPGDKPVTMSIDSLPGELGEVLVAVTKTTLKGKVRIKGSTWSAKGTVPLEVGTAVRVVRAEGVHVIVEPVDA